MDNEVILLNENWDNDSLLIRIKKQTLKCSILTIFCLVLFQGQTFGKTNSVDSLYKTGTVTCFHDNTHKLKWQEVAIPATLAGISALYVQDGCFKRQRTAVQNALSAKGKNKFKADDYVQYLPMTVGYGLGFCGVKPKHSLKDRTIILTMSYATMAIVVRSMKLAFNEKRPDSNATNSFPSGHTATAFMGAQFLYEEYKDVSPWIGYAGYAVAATTGYLRIYNNRHYLNDVIAGACFGVLSTKFAYWLYPKLFRKSDCARGASIVGLPCYSSDGIGMTMAVVF